MKISNTLPKAIDGLISLGMKAIAGGESTGEAIDLSQNTPAKIAADVHGLAGDPNTPAVPGAQAAYAAQKAVVHEAYGVGAVAVKAGREFCRIAISILKPTLGTRWNAQWNKAGFTAPTLALPADPVPMLIRFREFLNANPAREIAALGVTAAIARERLDSIAAAQLAIAQARESLLLLKSARDVALRKLKKRLSGLRAELEQILEPGDGRWYDFGFVRPIDGRAPAPVEGVTAAAAGPGAIVVEWPAAKRAESYRVSWNVEKRPAEESVLVGISRDRQCVITGLPAGERIVISVASRNRTGESAARETAVVVSSAPAGVAIPESEIF